MLKDVRVFFKQENNINKLDITDLEVELNNCINGRIKYADKCTNGLDYNHKIEVLQKLFLRDRVQDIKNLYNSVID